MAVEERRLSESKIEAICLVFRDSLEFRGEERVETKVMAYRNFLGDIGTSELKSYKYYLDNCRREEFEYSCEMVV